MAKKTTLGRLYIEQLKADQAAKRTNIEMATGLRRTIEEKLGRKLTNREAIFGELDHVDGRPVAERIADENWTPRMRADAPKSAAQLLLDEADAALRQEQMSRMTPAEYRVTYAKEMLAREQAQAIAAKAHEQFLASSADTIERLENLATDIRFDDSWSYSQARQIERALEAFRTPNVDPAFALEQANAAFGIHRAKVDSLAAQLAARRAEIEGQLADLQGELNGNSNDAEAVFNERWEELTDAMTAAQERYNALPQGTPAEVRAAAHAEWKTALNAVTAHRESQAALSGAGEG